MTICLTFLGLVILLSSEHAKSMCRIVLIAKSLAENNWRLQCTRIRANESHKHTLKKFKEAECSSPLQKFFPCILSTCKCLWSLMYLFQRVFCSCSVGSTWTTHIYQRWQRFASLASLWFWHCYHHIVTLFLTRLSKWWWFSKANHSWTTIWTDRR